METNSSKAAIAVKKLKQTVRQAPELCKAIWFIFDKLRGVFVCLAIHVLFVVVTTVGVLPYKVQSLENGYRKFVPVKGLRKWLTNGMYTFMVLRTFSYVLLPLSSKLKLAVGGNLTADCLIWVLNVQIAAVPAIVCYKFAQNPWDVLRVYNWIGEIARSATKNYFKGKHIYELGQINWVIVDTMIFTSACSIMAPFFAIGFVVALKDSPVALAYHISGPYSDIQDDETFRIVLYWICTLVHWLYINYVIWVMLTLLFLMGEGIIGITILLKNISSLKPEEISWRDKLKIHAQLEIILIVYNNWVGSAAPVCLLAALVFSVANVLTLMKMDLEIGFPDPALIPLFVMCGAGGALGCGTILRYAEELRASSVAYLKEVEDTITAWALLEVRKKKRKTYCPTGRTFRRRPIGVRLGSFMYMDEGLATSYLMQIQDNVINYFFMIDLRSHPMWLWKNF